MMFRKTRTHFQGASNRSSDRCSMTLTNFSLHKSPTIKKNQGNPVEIKNPFTSFLKKRSQKQNKANFSKLDKSQQSFLAEQTENLGLLEKQLKKKFKNSKNMVKLLKNWGVNEKGCLSKDELTEKIVKTIGKTASESNVKDLIMKHSNNTDFINSEGLISLLIGKNEGIPIDTMNLPVQHNNPFRQKLVDNLKEDLKNYATIQKTNLTDHRIGNLLSKFNTSISRMKKQTDGVITQDKTQFFKQLKQNNKYNNFELDVIKSIQKDIDFKKVHNLLSFHRNADYLFIDPLLRNPRDKSYYKQKQIVTQNDVQKLNIAQQLKSLPNLFKTSMKSQEKRAPFDPISLLNVDQRKTRLDKSNFTQQGSGWQANTFNQTIRSNQKECVLETLNGEATLKKMRYENKLRKIRQNKLQEQQRINQKQEKKQQRDKTHIQHVRDQQEAYNYINFIKKRWE